MTCRAALLLALALVAGQFRQPAAAAAAADPLLPAAAPDVATALGAVRDAVARGAKDHELVNAGEALMRVYGNTSDPLDPSTAEQAVEALSAAAAAAKNAPYQGGLRLELGKLLQLLQRPGEAQEALEAAVARLQEVDLPTVDLSAAAAGGSVESVLSYAAAAAEVARQPRYATDLQRWVLGRLLQATRSLHELGQEQRVLAILAPLPAAAVALGEGAAYISAMGQHNKLADKQLAELQGCAARLDQQPEGTPATADKDESAGGQAAPKWHERSADGLPCPWLRGLSQAKAAPIYYALHRALHSRKQYPAAWSALTTAKRLSGPGPEWEADDYEQMLADLAELFPAEEESAEESEPDDAPAAAAEGLGAAGNATAPPRAGKAAPQLALAGSARQALERAAGSLRSWIVQLGRRAGLLALPSRHKQPEQQQQQQRAAPGRLEGLGELRPIFVTGLPRSGSTLIEQILSSHPDVWGAGEHSKLSSVVAELLDDIADEGEVSEERLEELRRKYEAGMRGMMPQRALNASWLVDKNLGNAWHIGYISLLMPNACILHAARHPADTSLSSFQQSFRASSIPWSFNLTHMADHVAAHHRIMAHWRKALPGRVLDVHYSQMVDDMEGTTRKILDHCGLSWHPGMLRFYETQRFVYTASLLQVRRPIYTSSVNKWHKYKEGLAPLLAALRGTILRYEQQAGLPSSKELLDELAAAQGSNSDEEQQATAAAAEERQQGQASCTAGGDGGVGSCSIGAGAAAASA